MSGIPRSRKIGNYRDAATRHALHTETAMVGAAKLMHVLGQDSERRHSQPNAQSPSRASDLNLGQLFDRVLDAVVVAELATGRIVLWNPAAERLFGYAAV